MIARNSDMPKGLVFVNYRTSKKSLPPHETLPVLISNDALAAILKNEENPLYRVEAIDFPVKGSGGIYTGKFFESFLNRMKAHPFGGNKLGHSYPEKNDFYTVGGRIDKIGNGDSGTVYFKIVVPQMGYETTNSGFIRDLQAGNVHFSLVTLPEFELKKNEKTGEMERFFTASIGNERNDAVPYEGGAMPQQVNGRDYDYEQAKSLIEQGRVDYKSKANGDEIIQDGLVAYSALRRLAANADSRTPELTELVSLADKKRNRRNKMGDEDKIVTKEEALKTLKGLYANGLVSMAEIAEGIGSNASEFVRNDADRKNAELAKAVNEKLGENPMDKLDAMLNTRQETEKLLVENAVREQVGSAKIKNAKGEEVDNPAYAYAIKMCNGKAGKQLREALDALKEDPIMISLRGAQADYNSEFNRLEGGQQPVLANAAAPAIMEV